MEFDAGRYDIAVIGAGHAGIEAGLACARMGLETVVFTINLDAVGNMPCNPAIGGTGKGHASQVQSKQQRFHAHACGGQRRLASGVSRADDDQVVHDVPSSC